jgi:hypothetical protein
VVPMRTANGGDRSVSASARAAPTKAPKSETAVPTDHSQIRTAYPAPGASGLREVRPLLLRAKPSGPEQVEDVKRSRPGQSGRGVGRDASNSVAGHLQHSLHRVGRCAAHHLPAPRGARDGGDAVVRGETGDQTDQESRSAGHEPQLE